MKCAAGVDTRFLVALVSLLLALTVLICLKTYSPVLLHFPSPFPTILLTFGMHLCSVCNRDSKMTTMTVMIMIW